MDVSDMDVDDVSDGPPVFKTFQPTNAFGNQNVPQNNSVMYQGRVDYDEPFYPPLVSQDHADWTYVMRRTMQEIIPGLYLGPFASATKASLGDMRAAGLTHVICIRHPYEVHIIKPNHPQYFHYLTLEFADSGLEPLIGHLKLAIDFIEECRKGGGRCLVHGNAGISRSGAIVVGYIMAAYGVTLKEAMHHTQDIRFCVNPNDGFMNQLREFEPIYRAAHLVPKDLPQMEGTKNPLKRSVNENSDDEDEYGNKRGQAEYNSPLYQPY